MKPGSPSSWTDRFLMPVLLVVMLLGLWWARPRIWSVKAAADTSPACLANLDRIAVAFALYARDFDGRFPRGVDAEDHYNPAIWCGPQERNYGGIYCNDAHTAPLLPDLLLPYLKSRAVWHCPADSGVIQSRVSPAQTLRNIKPSMFARYGMSYEYYTIHGFAGMTGFDVPYPEKEVLLFDGDAWHGSPDLPTLDVLFADGHTANRTVAEFRRPHRQSS